MKNNPPMSQAELDKLIQLIQLQKLLFFLYRYLFYFYFCFTGISEEGAMRKDIIANLCVSDKTHSQLLDYVSFQIKRPSV